MSDLERDLKDHQRRCKACRRNGTCHVADEYRRRIAAHSSGDSE